MGTGEGVSVLRLISAFEKVCDTKIPTVVADRREGDIVAMYANPSKALKELNWSTKYSLEKMCKLLRGSVQGGQYAPPWGSNFSAKIL